MNWYPRYYGDYARDTAHLSLAEHGAYTILLDHYYSTRRFLPEAPEYAYRICRAFEDYEKAAVDTVLEQFFPVNGEGLRHNQRADRELVKEADVIEKRRRAAVASHAKGCRR